MPGYHLPYFAAAATGIFARHGLEVDLVDSWPGPDNSIAAARGDYDCCLTSVAYFLEAKTKEPSLPARFVFMVAQRPHMAAFTIAGRRARHGRPIADGGDLEGASFAGSPESPFAREYFALMRRIGARPGPTVDVAYSEVMDTLARGGADVAADYLDLMPRFQAAARRAGVDVKALPFHEAGLEGYGSGVVAGTKFIDERPKAVAALTAAIADALEATRRDPLGGLGALRDRFGDVDAEHALAGWRAGEPLIFSGPLGAMDSATWEATIAHHADAHGTSLISPDEAFDPSFTPAAIG